MKKFRRILSFIVAMAMIMSMSTLCFLVTAEGDASEQSIDPTALGGYWAMGNEFAIGEVGSTAVLESGNFALGFHDNGYDANTVPYPLSTTVTDVGGVASLVSTNPDSPKRAFSKSATGIIDINAEVGSPIVYFKAPADGTYYYELEVTGAWTGTTVKYWAGMGVRANDLRDTAFTNTEYVGLGNTAPTWNTSHHVYMNTVTVTKGQLIMFRPTNDGCDSANNAMTLNKFNVYRLDGGDSFAYDEENPAKVNVNYTLGGSAPGTGALDPLADAPIEDAWAANAWYGSGENSGTRYFATAQGEGSLIDLAPAAWVGSEISYTAPAAGKYDLNAQLVKRTGSSMKIEVAINRVYGESFITESLSSATTFMLGAQDIELKQGDQLTIRVSNLDGSPSNEVGVNFINVFYLGQDEEEHVCSEWNDDGTCKTNATCVSCGEKTGATNANNHELDTFTYTDNEDGATHTKKNACCGATVDATEAHVFEDGECDCGATYIAPAYSAGLATDTASVRKNQTAYVTVDIAGTNAKYAAGEIVVTFNDDIFNFNEAASTLPANTEVEATTGKIVLIITGADKEFGAEGATVTLAFDAANETAGSDITLSSAAFSLRADAKSEDLTAANITTATVSIEVTAQLFNVSVGEHLKADAEEVEEGNAFEFTYSAADGAYYDYDITVMSGTTDITEFVTFADGKWTVPAQYITDDLTITTTVPTAKEFGVTITPDGYATGNANAYYKTDYTFVIKADDGDESSTEKYNTYVLGEITIGGVKYEGATSLDGKNYTIPGTAITGAIVITIDTVEQDPGSVNVTVNAPADVTVDAEDKATLGQEFQFTVDFSQADTLYTYTVLYNGTPIEAVEGVYTTPNVTAPVVITVEKELTTNVIVKSEKEYLDLGEAGKMWLVLNDMDKLDGKVYTINGEEMFWSDRYEAYCYIVIAAEAPVANTFTIGIIEGTVTEIDYGMNVNKSANVDANDAQLVYDMYNKEYTSFDVVTMEKFLRADVNETVDFLVDTGDATAIITACVNKYIPGN